MGENNNPKKPVSMTVVACVESGVLEPLTIRMVDSLRRFGGRFANMEVVAVTPRLSPPLSRETRKQMSRLGIRHLPLHPNNPYAWHHYTNKAEAIAAVEREVTTEAIAWVDSDIIFMREPNRLELPAGVDFMASATDTGMVGSTGESDPNDPFWQRAAALIGKKADELPWLETGDGHRIRFYWNAGLYVYRRSTGFGNKFLSDLRLFLDRRVANTHLQVHAMDQVVLGLTVIRLGMNWQALHDSSNFPVCSFLPANYDPTKVADVSVLHVHDSMNPELWDKLLQTIRPNHPTIYAWLEPQGPVVMPKYSFAGMAREALRIGRGVQRRMYYAKLGFVTKQGSEPVSKVVTLGT
ncbi:MAG TPA: hypothetical protein VKF84_03490 [Candidatus Sulfotelmatobacter sp.]|nr:hypothetical protein [Candidatus Sulfotelmatobacter sp.]